MISKLPGALMALRSNSKDDSRINPPLHPEEYFEFVRGYYERAMLENPDSEWADSTTTAGYDFDIGSNAFGRIRLSQNQQ